MGYARSERGKNCIQKLLTRPDTWDSRDHVLGRSIGAVHQSPLHVREVAGADSRETPGVPRLLTHPLHDARPILEFYPCRVEMPAGTEGAAGGDEQHDVAARGEVAGTYSKYAAAVGTLHEDGPPWHLIILKKRGIEVCRELYVVLAREGNPHRRG